MVRVRDQCKTWAISPPNAVQISSRMTFVFKRVFPGLWFLIAGIWFLGGILSFFVSTTPLYSAVLWGGALLVYGLFIFRRTHFFDMMDGIWMDEDTLFIQNGMRVSPVKMANVKSMEVGFGDGGGAQWVVATFDLIQPSPWGGRVYFLLPTYKPEDGIVNPVLHQLRSRLKEAKH